MGRHASLLIAPAPQVSAIRYAAQARRAAASELPTTSASNTHTEKENLIDEHRTSTVRVDDLAGMPLVHKGTLLECRIGRNINRWPAGVHGSEARKILHRLCDHGTLILVGQSDLAFFSAHRLAFRLSRLARCTSRWLIRGSARNCDRWVRRESAPGRPPPRRGWRRSLRSPRSRRQTLRTTRRHSLRACSLSAGDYCHCAQYSEQIYGCQLHEYSQLANRCPMGLRGCCSIVK